MMPQANDDNYNYNFDVLRERKAGARRLKYEWETLDARRPMDSKKGTVPAPALLLPPGRFMSGAQGAYLQRVGLVARTTPTTFQPVDAQGNATVWPSRSANTYLE